MKLELRDITKSYEGESIFDNLDISFSNGLTQLSGDNGIGKTTLLKIIAQQIQYDGEIYLNDELIINQRSCCVLVSQEMNLLENLTVEENISFIVNKKENYHDIIDKFGLNSFFRSKVATLSGGERRKLSILLALLLKPKVLLLDEIFTFLDEQTVMLIKEQILEYSKDNIVILVDHSANMTDNIISLNFENRISNRGQDNTTIENKSISCEDNSLTKSYKKFVIKSYLNSIIAVLFLVNIIILLSFFILQVSKKDLTATYYINNNCDYYTLVSEKSSVKGEYDKYYTTYKDIAKDVYGITYYTKMTFKIEEEIAKHDSYLNCMIPDFLNYKVGDVISNLGENYYIYGKFKTNVKDIYDEGILTSYDVALSQVFIENAKIPVSYDDICLKLNDKEIKKLFQQDALITNTGIPWQQYEQLNKNLFVVLFVVMAIIFLGLGTYYFVSNAKNMKSKHDFLLGYSKDKKDILRYNLVTKTAIFSIFFIFSTLIATIMFTLVLPRFFDVKIPYPFFETIILQIVCLVIFLGFDMYINFKVISKETISE